MDVFVKTAPNVCGLPTSREKDETFGNKTKRETGTDNRNKSSKRRHKRDSRGEGVESAKEKANESRDIRETEKKSLESTD